MGNEKPNTPFAAGTAKDEHLNISEMQSKENEAPLAPPNLERPEPPVKNNAPKGQENKNVQKNGKPKKKRGCGIYLVGLALFYIILALLMIFNVFKCSRSSNSGGDESEIIDEPGAERKESKEEVLDWFGLHDVQQKEALEKAKAEEEARKAEEAKKRAEEEERRRAREAADSLFDDGLPVDGELPPSVKNSESGSSSGASGSSSSTSAGGQGAQPDKQQSGEALFN